MNKYDQIQSDVFCNTINHILQKHEIDSIDQLNRKSILPKLVEKLLQEKINGWEEIMPFWHEVKINNQMQVNYKIVIDHLSAKGINFPNCSFSQSIKDLIGLTWSILSKLYIISSQNDLINAVSTLLKDNYSSLSIKNMASSFANGLLYIELLSKGSSEIFQYHDKGDDESNFEYIKEICEYLNIPLVLTKDCISKHPDINCNCIQTYIILKELNCNIKTQQKESNEEYNKRRFNEKILELKSLTQKIIVSFDDEQKKFNQVVNCIVKSDVQKKSKFIQDFNKTRFNSYKNMIDDFIQKKETIDRLSDIYGCQIPDDLMSINQLKKQLNSFNSLYKNHFDHLNDDEENIKKMEDKVQYIFSFNDARNIYNQLRFKYDMNNWEKYDKKSFVYIAGQKFSFYENDLNNTIKEYNECISKFKLLLKSIDADIEKNSIDENTIENRIRSLDDTYHQACLKYYEICRKNILFNQIEFPKNDYMNEIKSIKDKFNQYRINIWKKDAENEISLIQDKCKETSLKIQKLYEYSNCYSCNLCEIVKNDNIINIPSSYKYENLLKKIGSDSNFENKTDYLHELIDQVQKKYDEAYDFLSKRENECKEIEQSSILAKEKSIEFKTNEITSSIKLLEEARQQYQEAMNKKIWDENSNGSTITNYENNMKISFEILENAKAIVDEKFNNALDTIKSSLKNHLNYAASMQSHYDYNLIALKVNEDDIKNIIKLKMIDHKMNLNHIDELNEINNELNKFKDQVNENIINLKNKMENQVNNKKEQIIKNINDIHNMEEELISDNSRINELNAKDINMKGSKLISKYNEIYSCKKFIEEYNAKYHHNIEIPDITNTIQSLHDYIIFYKSTFLLNPKSCLIDIEQRIQQCDDKEFCLAIMILYMNKYCKKNDKYMIEIDLDDKKKIESYIKEDKSIFEFVSKQIYNYINQLHLYIDMIQLDILIEFSEYLLNFDTHLIKYIIARASNKDTIDSLEKKINNMENVLFKNKLINIMKECKNGFVQLNVLPKINPKLDLNINNPNEPNEDLKIFIIDMGSYKCKSMIVNNEKTRKVFPSFLGRYNEYSIYKSPIKNNKDIYVGYETKGLDIKSWRPIVNGRFKDYNSIEELLKYIFMSQKVEEETNSVILIEPLDIDKNIREDITRLMFEQFNISFFCSKKSSVLATYSAGLNTSLAVDVGYETIRAVPVYNGEYIPCGSKQSNIGGNDINLFLRDLLEEQCPSYNLIPKIKRKCCYIPGNFNYEINEYRYSSSLNMKYDISKDKSIIIGKERIIAPEIMFNPSINKIQQSSIQKVIEEAINSCDKDIRETLLSNIVLYGGSSMFNGFQHRLQSELNNIYNGKNVNVIAQPDRKYAAFNGASVMLSLPTLDQMFITSYEFRDAGSSIIHRKCL